MNFTKGSASWALTFIILVACAPLIVDSQNYFFSTEFGNESENQRIPRQQNSNFFGRQISSGSASASAGGGTTSTSSSSSSGGNIPVSPGSSSGGLDPALQAQFGEVFDWNKDLESDPRFRSCTVPDIGDVSRACPKKAFFFGLNPQHRMAVGMVKSILTGPNDPRMTICLAGRLRDLPGMNPNVWIRGMLGAHLTNSGLFDLMVPPLVEVMPHIFISRESLQIAKRQATMNPNARRCTVVDGSVGADNGIENRLWYFREDIQVNSFHLNWHLIYPFTGVTTKADRQGELFYFSHHSHLARYHAERLSNGLRPVIPLNLDTNVPVPEPYHPHLDDTNSAMSWTPRKPNRPVRDSIFINITGVPPNISVSDRSLHVRRVEEAITNRGLLQKNGGRLLPLDSRTGIDILGDVVEASIFSPNPDYYGNFGFHNEGHVLLSLIEDPMNRTAIPPGVMLEVATSMRDPVFYTYHSAMDETFDKHKRSLVPYQPEGGELPLKVNGIEITGVDIEPEDGLRNQLTTFFNQKTFELSRGLDFNRSGVLGTVQACVTHLDHNPFTYRIYVNRHSQSRANRATVRIFLAPRFNENGQRYSLTEQRKLFFMLDLFTVQLQPGPNRITRRSSDSALTIDIPQSLPDIQKTKQERIKPPRNFCGCGWPHHLLIPRGTERGMIFDLFVMLTNGNEDYVAPVNPTRRPGECKPAPIYCGRLNDTYPDAKPMNYPFDRLPYSSAKNWWETASKPVQNLDEYTSGIPNMASVQVTITHVGQRQQRPSEIRFEGEAQPQSSRPSTNQNQNVADTFFPENNVKFDTTPTSVPPVNVEGLEEIPLIHQEHGPAVSHAHGNYDSSDDTDHDHGSSHYYNYNDFNPYKFFTQGSKTLAYFLDKNHNYAYVN